VTADTHFVCNPEDILFKMALKILNLKYIQGCQVASLGQKWNCLSRSSGVSRVAVMWTKLQNRASLKSHYRFHRGFPIGMALQKSFLKRICVMTI